MCECGARRWWAAGRGNCLGKDAVLLENEKKPWKSPRYVPRRMWWWGATGAACLLAGAGRGAKLTSAQFKHRVLFTKDDEHRVINQGLRVHISSKGWNSFSPLPSPLFQSQLSDQTGSCSLAPKNELHASWSHVTSVSFCRGAKL